jgi:hypothetical protein
MNNDLCISQTYSNDNVKTSRLHDTHIVIKNIKQSKLLTQKRHCQNFQRTSKHFNIEDLASDG